MKKKLMKSMVIVGLSLGVGLNSQHLLPVFAESTLEEEVKHDHEHDHEHDEHNHEHDHDHDVEFDAEKVVKKDGNNFIMSHGDHYHKISIKDLTQEQVEAAESYLESHPNLSEEYDTKQNIQSGYFEDEQVKDRELSDWAGEWQSVLPYLEDGTLDTVMKMKAEKEEATMSADEYKEYYMTGYASDVDKIKIEDNQIIFTVGEETAVGTYKYEGYKILNYEKGNRGVRYLFTKESGDESAPETIQFSDHNIYPTSDLTHFHIYMSDESHKNYWKKWIIGQHSIRMIGRVGRF
ncbi:zinc transport system substrate-binding protein [Facklamia miroungae]|uniref:Zinc transport system substrate-binding protein n=1 Tax=Facklamia miroungae TaxID=120956 RepID=A0A1G7NWQ1_9LACT|nr:zinc transport system substrate-binding protein [Facklamia miroungae]